VIPEKCPGEVLDSPGTEDVMFSSKSCHRDTFIWIVWSIAYCRVV